MKNKNIRDSLSLHIEFHLRSLHQKIKINNAPLTQQWELITKDDEKLFGEMLDLIIAIAADRYLSNEK